MMFFLLRQIIAETQYHLLLEASSSSKFKARVRALNQYRSVNMSRRAVLAGLEFS